MKISLIIASLGRTEELLWFLQSAQRQTFQDFEILIVDQNSDDRLLPIIEQFKESLNIRRLIFQPGLSRARNYGIQHASGDIVGFPDDDCWYEDTELLWRVAGLFETGDDYSVLLGPVYDETGCLIYGKVLTSGVDVTKYTCWRLTNSSAIFARRSRLVEVGGFHEWMGVGSGTPWASAEDIEIVARLIEKGFRILYEPKIRVCHPSEKLIGDAAIRKVRTYARGDGFLLRQHRYPWWFVGYMFLRPLVGTVLSILRGNKYKVRFYSSRLRARWLGYFEPHQLNSTSSRVGPTRRA